MDFRKARTINTSTVKRFPNIAASGNMLQHCVPLKYLNEFYTGHFVIKPSRCRIYYYTYCIALSFLF